MRAVAAGAAGAERIVRIFRVLGLVTSGAGARRRARILRVRIVAARAVGVTSRRTPLLDLMALAAGRLHCTCMRLMARRAGVVLGRGVGLSSVATGAVGAARFWMVRKVLMAVRALGVAGIRVGARVFTSMAIAAEGRRGHALHESVGLVALGAG